MNCKVITTGRVCCDGDLEVLLTNTTNLQNTGRWSIVFFTGGVTCDIPEKYVIASYDGTTYSNCRRVDNGNILCFFRNPQLGAGQLCYKLYLGIADSDFTPNFRDDVYPVATNYEVGPWPTDSVQPQLDLLVLSGIINAQIVGATATSLPPGSEPTVTLGGTATERTFAFGIPAGANGTDGTDGMDAAITGATASVGTGVGNPTVQVTAGGTPQARTFDFAFDGLTPSITADEEGVIYSNGKQVTDVIKEAVGLSTTATGNANDAADRANEMADNPPKIVEVDGMAYWAFYDLETKQYVTSQYRADVGDAVLFSAQELNAEQQTQVQTNIGVKSTVDAVGAGDIRTIDVESEKQSDGLRNNVGVIESSSDYFYTNPIPVNKGDVVLLNNTFATTNVMPIAKVSSDNTFIKAIAAGITGVHDYYAVAQGGYISLCVAKSYIKGIQAFIIPCTLTQAISEPAGGYNRKLYESYGAVYNEETGFYELNGFTDITEEEMWNIYRYLNFNDMAMFAGKYPYDDVNLKVRTNIPFQSTIQNSGSISVFRITHKWTYLCIGLRYVEKIVISRRAEEVYLCADNFIGCGYLLYDCPALVEIDGIIDFSKRDGVLTYVLTNCPKLKSFKLLGLHNDASFRGSPSINLDTFRYIIENSTNTGAITITVDPTIYGYLTGTIQPAPETGGTTEEWQALVTAAQEKQISFASA